MGDKEYYQILGRAVDDSKFEDEIKKAKNDDELKSVVSIRTGIELNEADLADVKTAVNDLPNIRRNRPGGKMRR
jgi:hypothetical protein